MSEIDDIIAAVSPNRYCKDSKKVIKILQTQGIGKAISYVEKNKLAKGPAIEHLLVYDSSSETLEPVYFWILDFMHDRMGGKTEKIIDNFASSPGSGHFSELGTKASQMQQEASRVLGTVNNILKGVLNLIYDLKEFKLRLSHYDSAKSSKSSEKEAGFLALKQTWMDRVDIQRGQGSLNALTSGDLNFITLRDAFLTAKSVEDIDKMDLNDRVKRILKPRLQEFLEWKKRSEQELRKRFEIEKAYLKSQVSALKLNTRWAKPYLRAAQRLTAKEGLESDAALVSVFNTIILELTLMNSNNIGVEEHVLSGDLPEDFKKMKKLRNYYSVVIADFVFRGIPSKMGQHYVFGGRVDMTFKSYALNEDELKLLKKALDRSDLQDSLQLVEGMTSESLGKLEIDIDEFLGKEEEETENKESNSNPFSALFSFVKPEKKPEKSEKEDIKLMIKKVIRDSYAERYLRNVGEAEAMNNGFSLYDIYKKGHGMASVPYGGEKGAIKPPKIWTQDFFNFPNS